MEMNYFQLYTYANHRNQTGQFEVQNQYYQQAANQNRVELNLAMRIPAVQEIRVKMGILETIKLAWM